MTIYNFNLGIGWASSGVEYAQAYRANIFRKNKQKSKFVFTDMFYENLQSLTSNIGFKDNEIIWLYQYFTDIKISPTTFKLENLESTFPYPPTNVVKEDNLIVYEFARNNLRLTAFLDKKDNTKVYKAEYVVAGKLIRRDYYSFVKIYSEYFKPVKDKANIYQRRFFNSNGSVAYDELINGKQSLYVFKDRTIYSKEDLITYFVESLNLSEKDILIIDRSTSQGPQILKSKGGAKAGVVIHAEHFNEFWTTKKKILWNNYYDYQFENASEIDFFITATQKQKNILKAQFRKYNKGKIKIYVIPVGSIDNLKLNENRSRYKLITASRLAPEKHIDWLIQAVVEARKSQPELTLDIYGQGIEEKKLEALITELGANHFIRLKGQQDLTHVYKEYSIYVTASTSEGFGLTLLEAVGSGLGLVGFDVRYGNQTFIKPNKNGYLVPYDKNNSKANVEYLREGILTLYCENESFSEIHNCSYNIAKEFLTESIQKSWIKLEKEITKND